MAKFQMLKLNFLKAKLHCWSPGMLAVLQVKTMQASQQISPQIKQTLNLLHQKLVQPLKFILREKEVKSMLVALLDSTQSMELLQDILWA